MLEVLEEFSKTVRMQSSRSPKLNKRIAQRLGLREIPDDFFPNLLVVRDDNILGVYSPLKRSKGLGDTLRIIERGRMKHVVHEFAEDNCLDVKLIRKMPHPRSKILEVFPEPRIHLGCEHLQDLVRLPVLVRLDTRLAMRAHVDATAITSRSKRLSSLRNAAIFISSNVLPFTSRLFSFQGRVSFLNFLKSVRAKASGTTIAVTQET
jgi:hypothetical protein